MACPMTERRFARRDAYEIEVAAGPLSYRVLVGRDLLARAGELLRPHLSGGRAAIVTDRVLAARYGEQVRGALGAAGIEAELFLVPEGEAAKRFGELEKLCRALLAARLERHDLVCGLGGGSIGDLAGLAASLVRRGVHLAHLPTSLLAQVDSAIGGKTAIDTEQGKNLIGSFYHPRLVISDIGVLESLPARAMRGGYAEIVKYALIGDRAFYDWLDEHLEAILSREPGALAAAIAESVRAKARIVGEDPQESGRRALLNLGHTFGHALETAAGHGAQLPHGEAVAVGLVLAFDFSVRLGLCRAEEAEAVRGHLRRAGLPVSAAGLPVRPEPDHLIEIMGQDKKVSRGRLGFILARGIGRAEIVRDPPREELRALLAGSLGRA